MSKIIEQDDFQIFNLEDDEFETFTDEKFKKEIENNDDSDDSDSDDSSNDNDDSSNDKNKSKNTNLNTDDSDDDQDNDDQDNDDQNDDSQDDNLNEYDTIISEYLEEGLLFLPEDYEYEASKEGLKKAFEDSEKYRNEEALKQAINYLTSKEGLNFIKIKQLQEEIEKVDIDNSDLTDDVKVEIIKKFYKEKGFDDSDIEEKIEDIINDDKIDKEFKVAGKYLKKEKELELEKEKEKPVKKVTEDTENINKTKQVIKKVIEDNDVIDGYTINKKGKSKIFDSIYNPVKDKNGNVTTEFSHRLKYVLEDPKKIVVLADILMNIDDEGNFNFQHFTQSAESKATSKIKKTIKDLSKSDSKIKTTGSFQTKKDFDLSKASLFTF